MTKLKSLKSLEPPDLARCQAETITRTPFALGGTHRRERCSNQPAFIATEVKPGADGRIGSMSLCPLHRDIMVRELGADFCTFEPIKAK